MTSWPPWRRMATVFDPMSPVPPTMTIFIFSSVAEFIIATRGSGVCSLFVSSRLCTALRSDSSSLDEGQQVGIHDLSMRRAHAMREFLIDLERAILEQLGRERRRIGYRHDLVVVAVHDERRDGDDLQVIREIRLRESLDAIVVRLRPAHHAL